MKAVICSINPKWCELIASGKKTIEVRKTKPKCDVPFKVYIYMTKDIRFNTFHSYNAGKVIGEFVCDRIIDVDCDSIAPFDKGLDLYIDKQCCLDRHMFFDYTKGKCAYGWHISYLKIYDEPKELSEFTRYCNGVNGNIGCKGCEYYYRDCNENIGNFEGRSCDNLRPITKPPQSWCYVEELE